MPVVPRMYVSLVSGLFIAAGVVAAAGKSKREWIADIKATILYFRELVSEIELK